MLFDSVPGHHVFKDLQTLRSEFWFQLVPIPARRQMSRAALRQTLLYAALRFFQVVLSFFFNVITP